VALETLLAYGVLLVGRVCGKGWSSTSRICEALAAYLLWKLATFSIAGGR
jgi:hypothetical protein